jgi:threonine synthase
MRPPLLERYRDRLPLSPDTHIVTLGEGGTPLVLAERLSERFGVELWLKLEGLNPTGSFKDRGMTLAVTKAVEEGAGGVVCASTGNTAASCAAYAARAGIEAVILFPEGAVTASKLAQAAVVGARLEPVSGDYAAAFAAAPRLADERNYAVVQSTNPYRLQGQKTAAFELVEQLGGPPDVLALPYGGGGNTSAYALGFAELDEGWPRFHPTQASQRADTVASAIRITEPYHVEEVDDALARSGGSIVTVSEQELVHAWRSLAVEEGVFCEPASAAGVAAVAAGAAGPGERVVCVITGHGLKDPEAVARLAELGLAA